MQRLFLLIICLSVLSSTLISSVEHHAQIKQKMGTTDAIFPRTDPAVIGKIYQMLKIIDLLFTQNDIPYWIEAGTALGALRHKGCIPWDDDADLGYHHADEPKILALKDEFAVFGFHLEKNEIIRLFASEKDKYPYVDLSGYILCTDHIYRYDYDRARRTYYHSFYWLPKEINNFMRVPFGPLMLNAPNDMMRYVKLGYGSDCMKYGTYQKPHRGGTNQKITKKVRIVDFTSAAYILTNPNVPLED